MVNIKKEFTIKDIRYINSSNNNNRSEVRSCNLSFGSDTIQNQDEFHFNYTFKEADAVGAFNYTLNCTYENDYEDSFSNFLYWNYSLDNISEINVSVYEPKLSLVADEDNPFSGLNSTSGFKLGNYDFNGDYVDDLIVLGDTFMVFDGNDLSVPAVNLTGFNYEYDFIVTDADYDGDGDVLIGLADEQANVKNITYLNNDDGEFNLTSSVVGSFSYLNSEKINE
jgi:hypothetical protein